MVCLEIYSKCKLVKYKSTICSKATVFILLTKIVSFLLPFILAYNSKGFWLKRDVFHEQPDIKYKYEYIFIAETNRLNLPILCSNIIYFQADRKLDKCSTIEILESDHNHDGKYDELFFSITVNNLEDLKIHSVILILSLDYKIHNCCPLHMQSYIIIQSFYNNPGVKMTFIGDISLFQNSPLPCHSQKIFTNYNYTLIENDFELWDFITANFKRNVSTIIDNSYSHWTSGSSETFTMDIKMRYPEQMIYYEPTFWQVIKFAWVQYLAVFVVIKYIINKIENYVFTNKLVLYHVDKQKKL